MRGITILFIVVLSAHTSFSQTNTFPSSGNVGIGTTSPGAKLEVVGDISLPNVSGNKYIYTWSPSDANWRIGMAVSTGFTKVMATGHTQYLTYANGAGQGFAIGVNGGGSSFEITGSDHHALFRGRVGIGSPPVIGERLSIHSDGEWQLRIKDFGAGGGDWWIGASSNAWGAGPGKFVISNTGQSPDASFVIDTERRVGIGTAVPTSRFEVNPNTGTSHNNAVKLWAGNGFNAFGRNQLLFAYHGGGGSYANAIKSRHQSATAENNAIDFYTWQPSDGSEAVGSVHNMTLNGGKVGIGTTSPAHALSIYREGNAELSITSNQNTAQSSIWFRINSVAKDGAIMYKSDGRMAFNLDNSGGAYVESNEYMTILPSGNIGVGTITPDAKLSVKGQIHAQEVKVDLNGAVAPDYVFNKDYKLPSLEEIRSYIEKNNHLPEVPSAKEMEANGMNLGEMNLMLLKKVEELTLYIIEMKKEIDDLKHAGIKK